VLAKQIKQLRESNLDLLIVAVVGSISGFLAGVAGLAGGIFIVPALTFIYGSSALQAAVSVSWLAVLFNSTAAVAEQARCRTKKQRTAVLKASRWFILGAFIVCPAVAWLISEYGLQALHYRVIGLLQLTLAAVMLLPLRPEVELVETRSTAWDVPFGGLVGAVSTASGTGGGAYTLAYFCHRRILNRKDAQAAANLVGVVVGVLSTACYLISQQPSNAMQPPHMSLSPWAIGVLLLCGMLVAPCGVLASRRISSRSVRFIAAPIVVSSGLRLIFT
jgi:uncharacterized membrane protein YfcA